MINLKIDITSIKIFALSLIPILYFLISLLTLPHYGINWDEPFHFNRGHAYLNYFLTGKENYLDIPAYPNLNGSSDFMGRKGESDLYLNSKSSSIPEDPNFRRSYFQSDVYNFEYFIENDGGGHPPVNGILSALFNYIFYQKLGIMDDIESHHLFEMTISFLLISSVVYFSYKTFGFLPALVSGISLSLYPLFFAESHFNIKDPVETSFFGLTIISFYFGIIKNSWRFILLSSFFAGLAIGTKFNALFLPFIIAPWIAWEIKRKKVKKNISISLILYPIIALGVFYLLWPYLWSNPTGNIKSVIEFYKNIGTTPTGELTDYIFYGFNTFPLYWILITTPLSILFLSLVGMFSSFRNLVISKNPVNLLVFLWLLIPILRVTLPGTTIHTGVRHIMEFIPALAIFSGIGAGAIYHLIKNRFSQKVFVVILTLMFIFHLGELLQLHPNENVYFNQLIGGLSGARDKNVPYWGYTYGNVYLQGVEWLNNNAPQNSKLTLAINNMVNVPRIKLRQDINFSNEHLSALSRQGEYVMEMSHNYNPHAWYSYAIYDKTLNPVYEVKIDGVSILKIWKNDKEFIKENYPEENSVSVSDFTINDNILTFEFEKELLITKLEILHSNDSCNKQKGGYIRLSKDGEKWKQMSETIDYPQIPVKWLLNKEGIFEYLFALEPAKQVFLDTQINNSCILKDPSIKIFYLKN